MKLYFLDTGRKGVREGYIDATETEDTYELSDNDLGVYAIRKSEIEKGVYYGFWKRQPTHFIGLNRGEVIDFFLHWAEDELEEHLDAVEIIHKNIKSVKLLLSARKRKDIDISEIPPAILQEGIKAAKESDCCGALEKIYAENYARRVIEDQQEIEVLLSKIKEDRGEKLIGKIIHDNNLYNLIKAIYGAE